ncbi:EamA family transporter [Limnohabitans sp. TS-CS-82]|uniref:DMT family transporter n=1 Tax=Limnohabitans sp. TS-CS-82 TaxID=2094193 RepID=UPI000CF2C411|nr:DMT family transporter [Limnohabitans sp. TS-CS-82]PQA80326.1 EamA family transporter [Limnohabitans sp. TS-CS-82]
MSANALSIVLLAGLLHALWNILAKKAGGDARFACFTAGVAMVVWAPIGVWIGWDVLPQWGAWEWGFVTASGVLHVLYFVVLLRGYRHADLTVVYPLARGTGPLLSSLVALVWLGESISYIGALGIAGVVSGVFLIAGGTKLITDWRRVDAVSEDQLVSQRLRMAGLRYGVLTGLFIACYTVVDGYAVKVLLMSPILLHYLENLVRFALLTPVVLRDRPTAWALWRHQWKYALIVGTITPISYVLVLYAMQTAPLSLVAPAREVSMLFAALIGGHLLGEGDRWLRVLGALLIAAGVAMLGLA